MPWVCQLCDFEHDEKVTQCDRCGGLELHHEGQKARTSTIDESASSPPSNEPDYDRSPDVGVDGSVDPDTTTESISSGGKSGLSPPDTENIRTRAGIEAVKAKTKLRLVVQLGGIALVLVGAYNVLLAGTPSEMIVFYPAIDVWAIQETYLVRASDVLAIAGGAAAVWFS